MLINVNQAIYKIFVTRTGTTTAKHIKQGQDVIVMNPKFYTYFLPSLHGQFFGSYPLIPFLKALTRLNFFNSKSTIYQIKSKMPYVGVESMAKKIKRAHK